MPAAPTGRVSDDCKDVDNLRTLGVHRKRRAYLEVRVATEGAPPLKTDPIAAEAIAQSSIPGVSGFGDEAAVEPAAWEQPESPLPGHRGQLAILSNLVLSAVDWRWPILERLSGHHIRPPWLTSFGSNRH